MSFYNYAQHPEQLENPLNNVGYIIKLLQEGMMAEIEEHMKEFELTAAQWHPLVIIDLKQADTPADIARIIDIDTGAMTRMLDRLEKKGFITRTRCQQDRRVIKLKLTEKGAKVTQKLMPTVETVLNQALSDFTAEEFTLFKQFMMRMLTNIAPNKLKHIQERVNSVCCKR